MTNMTKTKQLLLWLLAGLLPLSATAQDYFDTVLCLNLKDGGKVEMVLPVAQPEVACEDGWMTINYVENGQPAQLSWARDDVEALTFGARPSGIDKVEAQEERIHFDLTRAGVVQVRGLQAGDRLQAVGIDGKAVRADIQRQTDEGTAIVDLTTQPRGCYVISVNRRFTFKLMKP